MIIGLSDKAISGKDTAVSVLVKEFGFIRFAFADTMKQLGAKYFSLTDHEVYDNKTTAQKEYWY